jgi:hypothetical protein
MTGTLTGTLFNSCFFERRNFDSTCLQIVQSHRYNAMRDQTPDLGYLTDCVRQAGIFGGATLQLRDYPMYGTSRVYKANQPILKAMLFLIRPHYTINYSPQAF